MTNMRYVDYCVVRYLAVVTVLDLAEHRALYRVTLESDLFSQYGICCSEEL